MDIDGRLFVWCVLLTRLFQFQAIDIWLNYNDFVLCLFCFVIIQLIALLHRWNRLSFEKKVKSTCNEKKLYFVRVYFVMSLLLFSHNFFFCKIYHWIVCVVECKLKIKWITTERHIKKIIQINSVLLWLIDIYYWSGLCWMCELSLYHLLFGGMGSVMRIKEKGELTNTTQLSNKWTTSDALCVHVCAN